MNTTDGEYKAFNLYDISYDNILLNAKFSRFSFPTKIFGNFRQKTFFLKSPE